MNNLYAAPLTHALTVQLVETTVDGKPAYKGANGNRLAEMFCCIARQPEDNLWPSDIELMKVNGFNVEIVRPVAFPTVDPFIKKTPLYQKASNAYAMRKAFATPSPQHVSDLA